MCVWGGGVGERGKCVSLWKGKGAIRLDKGEREREKERERERERERDVRQTTTSLDHQII